jgi:hypothetical protein
LGTKLLKEKFSIVKGDFIMNKFTKGILSLGLALSILAGAAGTALADTKTGSLGGNKTTGTSTISKYSASVSTSFNGSGTVSYSTTYKYVNSDLGTGKIKRGNGTYGSSVSTKINAPSGYKSVRVDSVHDVVTSGQSWHATTYGDY